MFFIFYLDSIEMIQQTFLDCLKNPNAIIIHATIFFIQLKKHYTYFLCKMYINFFNVWSSLNISAVEFIYLII